jgi:hypothetical protein
VLASAAIGPSRRWVWRPRSACRRCGALHPKLAVEGGEPVCETQQTAPVSPGAAQAVVAYAEGEWVVLDPSRHLGVSGASMFGDVGQRLGDDEVRRRLDRTGEPGDGDTSASNGTGVRDASAFTPAPSPP